MSLQFHIDFLNIYYSLYTTTAVAQRSYFEADKKDHGVKRYSEIYKRIEIMGGFMLGETIIKSVLGVKFNQKIFRTIDWGRLRIKTPALVGCTANINDPEAPNFYKERQFVSSACKLAIKNLEPYYTFVKSSNEVKVTGGNVDPLIICNHLLTFNDQDLELVKASSTMRLAYYLHQVSRLIHQHIAPENQEELMIKFWYLIERTGDQVYSKIFSPYIPSSFRTDIFPLKLDEIIRSYANFDHPDEIIQKLFDLQL